MIAIATASFALGEFTVDALVMISEVIDSVTVCVYEVPVMRCCAMFVDCV